MLSIKILTGSGSAVLKMSQEIGIGLAKGSVL
jgi:hypothetical protein